VFITFENKTNSVNKKKHMEQKIKGAVTQVGLVIVFTPKVLSSLSAGRTGQPQDISDLMLIQLTRVALSLSYVANLHK